MTVPWPLLTVALIAYVWVHSGSRKMDLSPDLKHLIDLEGLVHLLSDSIENFKHTGKDLGISYNEQLVCLDLAVACILPYLFWGPTHTQTLRYAFVSFSYLKVNCKQSWYLHNEYLSSLKTFSYISTILIRTLQKLTPSTIQVSGHLMWRATLAYKDLMLKSLKAGGEGDDMRMRWLAGIIYSDDTLFEQIPEMVHAREPGVVVGLRGSKRVGHDWVYWTTTAIQLIFKFSQLVSKMSFIAWTRIQSKVSMLVLGAFCLFQSRAVFSLFCCGFYLWTARSSDCIESHVLGFVLAVDLLLLM